MPVAASAPQAMDRLLEVLDVDVLDLANPEELRSRALQRPERTSSFVSVPLCRCETQPCVPALPFLRCSILSNSVSDS